MWLKVYKTYRGGRSKDDYIKLPKDADKDDRKEYAVLWAENSPGGENYGWMVHWEPVDSPPLEWLRRELRYTISSLQRYAIRQNKKIRDLLEDIRCQKEKK